MTVLGQKMDFYKALNLCYEVGGIMQLPKKNGSLLYENIASYLPPHCNGFFWIPIVQSENNISSWINAHIVNIDQEVGDLPWGFGQPNGKPTLLVFFIGFNDIRLPFPVIAFPPDGGGGVSRSGAGLGQSWDGV